MAIGSESSPVPADFEDCECWGSLRPAGARERKTRPHTRLRVLQTVSFAPAFYGEVPPAVHLLPLLLHAECASAEGCYCASRSGSVQVLLHMATVRYARRPRRMDKCQPLTHGQVALREEALYPAGDIGRESGSHQVLGHKHVPMMLLDAISGAVLLAFMMGTLLLRDLRLWCKMFFSNGMLFVLKGIFDWVTIIPDSIGWHECERRLKPEPLEYLRKMATLDGSKYAMALWELETQGVAGIWPVRYCSDMLLSGHTAVMLLYLLGLSDLVRRTTLLMDTTPRDSFCGFSLASSLWFVRALTCT
ncbi:unnamed protein product [Effrenium voratum]|uniref:Sphingomyelin synthase-like domain-containing protein n=1 Tax=Effrenium voratum TaxID=2562239 RepID=A0AA36I5H2_9DINO|nr:unnamed protein product [Effrenium voratum]